MIKVSPAELQSICNAAYLGIKQFPDGFKRTKKSVDKIMKFIHSVNWDEVLSECIFIDELPF